MRSSARCKLRTGWRALCLVAGLAAVHAIELRPDGYHVFPSDNIQDAIEMAAKNDTNKNIRVHPGIYQPRAKRQALIWLNHLR